MMYHNKFVVAIKHNGKVLREIGDLVHLPFGSEFTILVKNLNSRRAKFTVHIDGQDVLNGTELIVNANSETELKRFIRDSNSDKGNAFKFIERTAAIEDGPRGIKADDGIVRVEYWFEQEVPEVKVTYHKDVWYKEYKDPHYWPYYDWYNKRYSTTVGDSSIFRSRDLGSTGEQYASYNAIGSAGTASSAEVLNSVKPQSVNEVGITVPGSTVDQKFIPVYGFNAETKSEVIILRLIGKLADNKEVKEAITVEKKQTCSTCGRKNKMNAKFCTDCGTALTLL